MDILCRDVDCYEMNQVDKDVDRSSHRVIHHPCIEYRVPHRAVTSCHRTERHKRDMRLDRSGSRVGCTTTQKDH
jgi:hypothetical protein